YSKEQFQVVGIRIDKTQLDVTKEVEKIKKRLHEIKNRVNSTIFCVNPLEESFLYVCVEVENAENIPLDMDTVTVPTQDYAVFVYNQPPLNFRDSYKQKYDWLQGWTHLKKKPKNVFIIENFMDDCIESYL